MSPAVVKIHDFADNHFDFEDDVEDAAVPYQLLVESSESRRCIDIVLCVHLISAVEVSTARSGVRK